MGSNAGTRRAKEAPTRPALRARWERRREEVVAGAAEVFAKHGYYETSVADLADRLGLATGALYHYFGGKEELLVAICNALTDPLLASARGLPESGSGPERLRGLVRLWVMHVAEHRNNLLVFTQVRHAIDRDPAWRRVRTARKEFENLLAATLERAAVPDPELRRLALLGMVNHLPQWYRPSGSLSAAEIADGWTDAILAR
jgi:TetR/AcrR family transcriptional regulator, cholesterol catabolism regulator